jgi:hypothetical protein
MSCDQAIKQFPELGARVDWLFNFSNRYQMMQSERKWATGWIGPEMKAQRKEVWRTLWGSIVASQSSINVLDPWLK